MACKISEVPEKNTIVGAPTIIHCSSDGSKRVCAGGTRDCFDDSPTYCEKKHVPPSKKCQGLELNLGSGLGLS